MLWLALHLPLLSLESFAATLQPAATGQPLALIDAHAIRAANGAARALGVRAGLKRATALALAPQLTLGAADPRRDAQALSAVAHAALAFTPNVSTQPPSAAAPDDTPHTVLLEVQASLRYFGGLVALRRRLLAALAPLGHRVHCVSARTALGAALLARAHPALDCDDLAATRRALDAAPVWLLGPGRAHWEALQGMGLRTIADLRSVPRDGLARRFGEVVLGELDRASGTRPDPREPIVLPPTFDGRLELFARADTSEQLLHGAAVLLARLVAWLAAQHAFVRRFTLTMEHERRSRRDAGAAAATRLEVALAEPSRDAAHLQLLLRERLAQLTLPAPTLELALHADDIARRAPPNAELFPTPATEHEGLTRLIERLQARLGREQVLRLAPLQDHRPECATACRIADASIRPAPARGHRPVAEASPRRPARPVWLLHPPEPLPERAGAPWCGAEPLQLLSGPERIESGWWEAPLVERDYYIAQLPDGALVWIYRSRVPVGLGAPCWFLQGRFG
ncbi:MAG TPA: DNA polymerase Y family protein [Burkholderiaceae bacterium]|nr:DNA polymerase Y family protein [Burkholderiaceae bacterium]